MKTNAKGFTNPIFDGWQSKTTILET